MPQLPINDDPRTTAFRWLVTVLKADATCRRLGLKFWIWDGAQNQAEADLPITQGIVRLTPKWEPEVMQASNGSTRIYEAPVTVTIEASHVGSFVDSTGNLATVINDAIQTAFDTDRALGASRKSKCSWIDAVEPAQLAGENPQAVGSVRLMCYIKR